MAALLLLELARIAGLPYLNLKSPHGFHVSKCPHASIRREVPTNRSSSRRRGDHGAVDGLDVGPADDIVIRSDLVPADVDGRLHRI